jgi:DDE superfamily endonuclease
MPTGYTWARTGIRAVVRREDKKNRRINVLGAYAPAGAVPDLLWQTQTGKIDARVLLEFVCTRLAGLPQGAAGLALPPAGWRRVRPCTVVLEGASAHVAHAFKDHRSELEAVGVELFYRPPRSPELNRIERVWRSAKYEDYPHRSQTTIEELERAVDAALIRQRMRIRGSAHDLPQAA